MIALALLEVITPPSGKKDGTCTVVGLPPTAKYTYEKTSPKMRSLPEATQMLSLKQLVVNVP